jgi:hypothetical protein
MIMPKVNIHNRTRQIIVVSAGQITSSNQWRSSPKTLEVQQNKYVVYDTDAGQRFRITAKPKVGTKLAANYHPPKGISADTSVYIVEVGDRLEVKLSDQSG